MNTSITKTSNYAKKIQAMKLLPIALLLSILCLSSCGKFRCTVIEGHILEYGSDKPIEGAKVEIYQWYSTDVLSGGSFFIDTVFTDSEGHFKWESDKDIGSDWYEIRNISADTYYTLSWDSNFEYYKSIKYRDHYNKTMYLDPYAYLHLHVEDVPEVEGSYVRFGGTMIPGSSGNILENGEQFKDFYLLRGNNETFNLLYFTYDKNPSTAIEDTIVVPAHDTLYYHLKY